MSPRAKTPATASALEEVLAQINERLGPGTVIPVGSRPEVIVGRVPTGIPSLDLITGGGLPRGRVTEIFGTEASAKTSICLFAAGHAVRRGEQVLYVDSENAVDSRHSNLMGLDLTRVILAQPGTAEEAFDVIETVTATGQLSLVVVDSMAALSPRSEIQGDYGDANVAVMARLNSQWMRKFAGILSKTQTALVIINQLRSKVGLFYGNPNVPTGGNAIKYYASLRLECSKKETIKKGTEPIGAKIRVKVPKSKVSRPFVECEFDILSDMGIDTLGSLIDLAKETGVITAAGAYLSFGDVKAQGKDKFRDLLSDPVLLAALTEALT